MSRFRSCVRCTDSRKTNHISEFNLIKYDLESLFHTLQHHKILNDEFSVFFFLQKEVLSIFLILANCSKRKDQMTDHQPEDQLQYFLYRDCNKSLRMIQQL